MTHILQDILKLSVSERILMIEAIWDSIEKNDDNLRLSSEAKNVLDGRLEDHLKNPHEGSSWEKVKTRIRKQF